MPVNPSDSNRVAAISVLQEISRIVSSAKDHSKAAAVIATRLLEHLGLEAVEIRPDKKVPVIVTRGASNAVRENTPLEKAAASLVNDGRIAGSVILYFRHSERVEELRNFATFTGQQIGLLLSLHVLTTEHRRLAAELSAAKQQLESRKRLDRARGILATKHLVTEDRALEMLKEQSVRTGRPVGEVAEIVVGLHKTRQLEGPPGRRGPSRNKGATHIPLPAPAFRSHVARRTPDLH